MVPYSSFEASTDVYSEVSDDEVSFLDLNEAEPAAELPQPVCSAGNGREEQVRPRTYRGYVDDDPYYPWEGVQLILPRKRPINASKEEVVWWID